MGRKKSAAINDLISAGLVGEGELLRYKNKAGQLLLIGRARVGGIEVKGAAGLLNFTAFEAASGAKYHRPAEHTHAISGRTLQALQLGAAAAADGAGGGSTAADRSASEAAGEPLVEEEHDEFCYVCGLGGDLMCCETCSTTMHAPCAGLERVPEGDWYCPWCHCGACGQPGDWGEQAEGAPAPPLLPCGVAWVECGESYRSLALGTAGAGSEQPLRPPYVGASEEAGEEAGAGGVGAPAAGGAADGAVRMDIDGAAMDSAAAEGAEQLDAAGDSGSGPEGAQQPSVPWARPGSGRLDLTQLLGVLAEAAASTPPAAALLGGAAAGEGAVAQSAGAGTAAAGEAVEARCPVTGQRHHARCLPPGFLPGQQQQQQQQGERDGGSGSSQPPLWFSSKGAELLSWRLAQLCSRGLVPVGTLGDGTPVSFQLVRGAAVAQPQDCCGYAPSYSQAQREELRRALSAAAVILQSCYEPLVDSRTGGNAMLWMLRGACLAGRQLDLSAMHTALLYVGSSLAAAACVQVLGPSVAEVPLLATRPELQRNKLGSALLAVLEAVVAAVYSGTAGSGGGSGSGGGAGAPLLLTPAFWGPGSAYIAYPPGQPGVPDVVPIMQAKWGYALATKQQLLEAWRHPLQRLPGLLLACKQLGGHAAAGVQLPRRLVLNEAGCDVGRMLKEGTAVLVPKEEPAAPIVKDDPMVKEEGGIGTKVEQGNGAGF